MPIADCLAQAVYYEARGESVLGQRAVAYVVLNRGNPCRVISEGCQFSWKCASVPAPYGEAWRLAKNVAQYVLANPHLDVTQGATHFYSGKAPYWVRSMTFKVKIGKHYFYEDLSRYRRSKVR